MLKNLNCFICDKKLTTYDYKMIAFDRPYLNIFVCKECSNNQEELIKKVELWYNLNRKENSKNGKK